MTHTEPSRRGLLSGLFALLFGWLVVKKALAAPKVNLPVPVAEGFIVKGQISSTVFDGNGSVITYVYDAAGQRLCSIASSGLFTTMTYDGGPH